MCIFIYMYMYNINVDWTSTICDYDLKHPVCKLDIFLCIESFNLKPMYERRFTYNLWNTAVHLTEFSLKCLERWLNVRAVSFISTPSVTFLLTKLF